jgi:hypothetical protein
LFIVVCIDGNLHFYVIINATVCYNLSFERRGERREDNTKGRRWRSRRR